MSLTPWPARFTLLVLLGAGLLAGARAEARWYAYPDCHLIANEFNDGDSFHVKRGRKHEIYRLYFVDTAETDQNLEERIDDQAAYWDIPADRIHALGRDAKQFTAEFLKNGFSVQTQFEDARGNSDRKRSFAFVQAGERDLAEALVEAGLARIYGRMVDHPDGRSLQKYLARLKAAERHAREARRGAWGIAKAGARPRLVSPTSAMSTNILQQTLVLTQPLAVYSLRTSGLVGVLKSGMTVRVLGADSPVMVRISFSTQGTNYLATCRRSDLGI
ncbi:MAG: thermonuclease family protein [Lentisphaerae bacterium]|nr:thermonuclease family protein [Lentisphaerota bacterium]